MNEVKALVRRNPEIVLRETHLKVLNKMCYVNIVNEKKNPYIQKVRQMEEELASK